MNVFVIRNLGWLLFLLVLIGLCFRLLNEPESTSAPKLGSDRIPADARVEFAIEPTFFWYRRFH